MPAFPISREALVVVGVVVTATLWLAKRYRFFSSIDGDDRGSAGLPLFAFAFTVLVLFYDRAPWIMSASILTLAVSDAAAAVFGERFAKRYYRLGRDKKSFVGNAAFVLSALLVWASFTVPSIGEGILGFESAPRLDATYLAAGALVAATLAAVEAVSSRGFDNLTVPLAAAFLYWLTLPTPDPAFLRDYALGAAFGVGVAVASYRLRFLAASGAAATALLATLIFAVGGLTWTIPMIVFFVASSALSKIRKRAQIDEALTSEKTGTRDLTQVFANGGAAGACAAGYAVAPDPLWFVAYCGAIAAACADTWSTEIGTMKPRRTRHFFTLKPVPQGESGGVSAVGTLGGAAGASAIAATAAFFLTDIYLIFIVLIAGVFGGLFDSALGATAQEKRRCERCDALTERREHCGSATRLISGAPRLTNDGVNLLATAFGGAVAYLLSVALQ